MNTNDKLTQVARDAAHPTPVNPIQALLDDLVKSGRIQCIDTLDDGEGSAEIVYEVNDASLAPIVVIRISTLVETMDPAA